MPELGAAERGPSLPISHSAGLCWFASFVARSIFLSTPVALSMTITPVSTMAGRLLQQWHRSVGKKRFFCTKTLNCTISVMTAMRHRGGELQLHCCRDCAHTYGLNAYCSYQQCGKLETYFVELEPAEITDVHSDSYPQWGSAYEYKQLLLFTNLTLSWLCNRLQQSWQSCHQPASRDIAAPVVVLQRLLQLGVVVHTDELLKDVGLRPPEAVDCLVVVTYHRHPLRHRLQRIQNVGLRTTSSGFIDETSRLTSPTVFLVWVRQLGRSYIEPLTLFK